MRSDTVRKGTQQAPHRSLFNALGMYIISWQLMQESVQQDFRQSILMTC